jgi:hypothetical protein
VIRFQFDPGPGILTSILVFILCALAVIGLATIRSNTGNDGARLVGIWIVAATGILTPLVILARGMKECRKGDLLRYRIHGDVMELPRENRSIENARQRVYFSSEHYSDGSNHFFEFNLVLDGQRLKFLSSSVANGFRSIAKPLETLGFPVNHQKITIQ